LNKSFVEKRPLISIFDFHGKENSSTFRIITFLIGGSREKDQEQRRMVKENGAGTGRMWQNLNPEKRFLIIDEHRG
jgi:hypothetical protein